MQKEDGERRRRNEDGEANEDVDAKENSERHEERDTTAARCCVDELWGSADGVLKCSTAGRKRGLRDPLPAREQVANGGRGEGAGSVSVHTDTPKPPPTR